MSLAPYRRQWWIYFVLILFSIKTPVKTTRGHLGEYTRFEPVFSYLNSTRILNSKTVVFPLRCKENCVWYWTDDEHVFWLQLKRIYWNRCTEKCSNKNNIENIDRYIIKKKLICICITYLGIGTLFGQCV